ncbi:MAG: type II toxin-antitoxin system RelB/DinJ family antitoxin [Lachnospiraceae bacterium]|nr:type II toxin-antitoxin system RelB/DinJ family antitoxin [Lachnospiraceae bacterium]
MSQSTLSVRVNSEDKKIFEEFCSKVGMNTSVAVNMFVKAVIREQKLPFEIKADPFYSNDNMKRLKKSIKQLDSGKGKEHEIVEEDD